METRQVLARMDTRDLEASLKKAEAQAQQAQHALDEAESTVVQRQSQLVLAQQELERTQPLAQRGSRPRSSSTSVASRLTAQLQS